MTEQLRIRVTGRARTHIARAVDWWEINRPLAPGAIDEELADAFALIASQPKVGAIALNTRTPDVRRLHLSRIHYYLYYRTQTRQVEVLALWHTSRGVGPPV